MKKILIAILVITLAGCTKEKVCSKAVMVGDAGKQFLSGRKVGKMHQNVFVFYKGDIKQIKQNFGEVAIMEQPQNITNP